MEVYTTQLGDHISAEDALKVAHYYEKSQDFGKAGRCVTWPPRPLSLAPMLYATLLEVYSTAKATRIYFAARFC